MAGRAEGRGGAGPERGLNEIKSPSLSHTTQHHTATTTTITATATTNTAGWLAEDCILDEFACETLLSLGGLAKWRRRWRRFGWL